MRAIGYCIFSILMFLSLDGCGRTDSLPDLVPVTGTVTYRGKPLSHGRLGFAPVDPAQCESAIGVITNGTFSARTTVSSPGVQIGKYRVSVASYKIPEKVDPSAPAAMAPAVSIIPERYGDPMASGLEVDVKPGMTPLTLELTD